MVTGGHKEGKKEGKPETVRMPISDCYRYEEKGEQEHDHHIAKEDIVPEEKVDEMKKTMTHLEYEMLVLSSVGQMSVKDGGWIWCLWCDSIHSI